MVPEDTMALLNENDEQAARDSLGGLAKVVASIADLRQVNQVCYRGAVDTLYGTTPGDGLAGRYRFDSTSAAADNGTTIIAPSPTPATGRWLLVEQQGGGGGSSGLFAYKTANQAGSGFVRALDADLQLTVEANGIYDFELVLMAYLPTDTSRYTNGWQLADPGDLANVTIVRQDEDETYSLYGRTGTPTNWASDSAQANGGALDDMASLTYRGMYFVGPNPTQVLGVSWHGGNAPNNATLLKGSYLRMTKRN